MPEKEKSAPLSTDKFLKMADKILQNQQEDAAFAHKLADYVDGRLPKHEVITVGETPNVLRLIGSQANKVLVTQGTIQNSINPESVIVSGHSKGHDLPLDIVRQLPEAIRNPIAICNGSKKDSVVIITELQNKKKENVIVPIAIDIAKEGKPVNKITSIYGKEKIDNLLNRGVLAVNMNKASELGWNIVANSTQFASIPRFDSSIAYTMENVTYPADKLTEKLQAQAENERRINTMEVQIVAKGIQYDFKPSDTLTKVQKIAEETAKEMYKDEQDFAKEEYETMLADGDVANYDEYKLEVGISPTDVDYSKSFEENKSHPVIEQQIRDLTNTYMSNVRDLPQNAVVSIDESFLDSKGRPNANAVRQALSEKLGADVKIESFDIAAKAESKDILAQEAYEKVGEMLKSADFNAYLDLRESIGKYSHNNIALIYAQKPDSKAVMGFSAWKQLDRHVDAGQQGIKIYQPCSQELKTEKQVDNYIARHKEIYGLPDSPKALQAKLDMMNEISAKGSIEKLSGFRLGTTFDISQTVPNNPEHDNIDKIINLDRPLNKELGNYDDVVKAMKDAATHSPLSIRQDLSQQDALYEAVTDYADKLLKSAPETVTGIKSNIPLEGDMHKIETAMSAYLICKHIGIDSAEKASLKLTEIFNNAEKSKQAVTVGKREMFVQAFDRACKVADQFNKEFDKSFGYDLEAQRDSIRKEVAEKQTQSNSKNRIYFGRNAMQKVDEWKSGELSYTLAQSEKTGIYAVKTIDEEKHGAYLLNDNKKVMQFKDKPTREAIENLMDKQNGKTQESEKTTEDKEAYRYYTTMRPVTLGSVPNEKDNPIVNVKNYDDYDFEPNAGTKVYGYAEYSKPLTEKEISTYELVPHRPVRELAREAKIHSDIVKDLTSKIDGLDNEKADLLIKGFDIGVSQRPDWTTNEASQNRIEKMLKSVLKDEEKAAVAFESIAKIKYDFAPQEKEEKQENKKEVKNTKSNKNSYNMEM